MSSSQSKLIFVPARIFASALILAMPFLAWPQALSQTEKQEAKIRVEYLKAVKGMHVNGIKAQELLKIINDTNLVLIDVRESYEQRTSMLPHALTTREFADAFRHGIPPGKRTVVYCTIGYRSAKYAEELAKQGIRAENLEGGVLAWSHCGGDFYTDSLGVPVKTYWVHVSGKDWNFLHPSYRAIW